MILDYETHAALSAEAGLPLGMRYVDRNYVAVATLPGHAPESHPERPVALACAIAMAERMLASDDLNAGFKAHVVEVSTGRIVWPVECPG